MVYKTGMGKDGEGRRQGGKAIRKDSRAALTPRVWRLRQRARMNVAYLRESL